MIDAKHTQLNYDKIGAFTGAGFDEKIVSLAFKQASMREKHSINYIETILYNWKSNGLNDIAAIESDINERKDRSDKAYAFYKKSGLDGRLTQFQIEAFEKWLFIEGFEYDMMLEVADYSKGTKNANQYMAKIFSSMKEKRIFTKSSFLSDIKNSKKDTPGDNGKKTTQYSAEDFQNMLTDIE